MYNPDNKYTMKRNLFLIAILLFAFACKNGETDKKAKLEKLIKQRDELTQEINKLKLEVGSDSSHKKMFFVSVSDVQLTEFNHYIEVQGKVDGDQNIAVPPKQPGVVTAVYVKEGDAVRKGQILAELDNQVFKQSIAELQNQLDFANNLYLKQKNLWDKKIGSEVQYLTAKNNKESLEKKMQTMKDQLDQTRIIAPINGTIEEVNLKEGEMAAAGFPAFRVVNFSSIKVKAEVAESYGLRVKKGDKVYVKFPDLDKDIESPVTFASRFINPTNRTFTIETKLSGGSVNYRANMIAQVKLNDYKKKNVVVIPVNAVDQNNGKSFVYIATDGKAKKVEIQSGQSYNGNLEVISGIKTGDKLIVNGFQGIEDGDSIKF